MSAGIRYIILVSIFLGVCSVAIRRDIRLEQQYPGDLRNRIVGARLQMDGKLPYFYRWRPEDGLRYYDPIRFDTTYVNAITASPFFHRLLYPIANLPQRTISRIWLWLEYVLFLATWLMALGMTENWHQKWAVLIVGALMLFTEAWKMHVLYGQMYVFFPFLCMVCFYFLVSKKTKWAPFAAGLAAAILLLSKPSFALFFLPFLFHRYSVKWMIRFLLPIAVMLILVVADQQDRSLWADYQHSVAAHIKDHQSPDRLQRTAAYHPVIFNQWEGWNWDAVEKAKKDHPAHLLYENAGVQSMIKQYFNRNIPYSVIGYSFLFTVLLLIILFILRHRHTRDQDLVTTVVFGFCLYMMVDLFSPILRSQYYGVQWLFPLLLVAAHYHKRLNFLFVLLVCGLILNITNTRFIAFRHTKGEYLILISLLCICLNFTHEVFIHIKRKSVPIDSAAL